MRLSGVLAVLLSLPVVAAANSLIIEVWPNADPNQTIYCAMTLTDGRFSTLEVIGHGAPDRPLQWYSTEPELRAMGLALQSLIGGTLSGQVILTSRTPPPPYLSATWVANVDNATASGIYIQPGVILPDALLQAILTVLPGGPCARHLGG
jgi:hypothetical protein